MANIPFHRIRTPGPRRQRGATLFVALTILIALTLLALAAAQVTTLQERMSGIYRSDLEAFQHAEEELRRREGALLDDPALCGLSSSIEIPDDWRTGSVNYADAASLPEYVLIENLNGPGGISSGVFYRGSLDASRPVEVGGEGCLVFRVSSIRPDNADDPASRAIVQSIIIP